MNLTKMIFDYWKYHMVCPVETIKWYQDNQDDWQSDNQFGVHNTEGVSWCDGHVASFWYMLNLSWYQMNDKLFANTRNTEPFDSYLRDFDEDYLKERLLMTEPEKTEIFECTFPKPGEGRGSEVTELPIIIHPAPDRGERRMYYIPTPKDTPGTGTENRKPDEPLL